MFSFVYLVEYTLHQNLMIELYTRNFDLHITVRSPNLAFLCRNLDYKPYSINHCFYVTLAVLFLILKKYTPKRINSNMFSKISSCATYPIAIVQLKDYFFL